MRAIHVSRQHESKEKASDDTEPHLARVWSLNSGFTYRPTTTAATTCAPAIWSAEGAFWTFRTRRVHIVKE